MGGLKEQQWGTRTKTKSKKRLPSMFKIGAVLLVVKKYFKIKLVENELK